MMMTVTVSLVFAVVTTTTIRNNVASAFSPSAAFRGSGGSARVSSSSGVRPLNVVFDHGDLPNTLQTIHDFSLTISDAASATADAASVTADAAADAAKDGWWQNYLNFMESCLIKVHSTIDEPLQSVGVTQTWGPSIFLFTAGVRSLLLPLSIKQSSTTEYTKALKPYQDDINKKYASNKDMLNRATAKLYEDAGTNPLSGCALSLAQIPVFLGLYRGVTRLAKDGFLDEPFLWIPSLQGPVSAPNYRGLEWLTEGWTKVDGSLLPVPSLGWETTLAFLVMPVLLVTGQKLTMTALSPEAPDTSEMSEEEKSKTETSQTVLKFLPLLIGFFSLQVPAGLTIYWFTSNFFTLSQSLGVKAYYKANPPQIELPDYWDALDTNAKDMTPEEKRKAAESGLAVGPTFDELLDDAKFHPVVERLPLREDSAAWARLKSSSAKAEIPAPMLAWVQADTTTTAPTNGANGDVNGATAAATTPLEAETAAA